MKKLFSLFSILFLLCFSYSNAQVNTYSFSQPAGVYSAITGTLLDSSTSTSGATSLDDVVYLNRPIGFSFVFNGISYTDYSMNTNGQITFGTTSPGTTNYNAISSTVAYAGCVAGLARDLQGLYGFTATRTATSNILTGVTNFAGIVVGKRIVGTGIAANTRVTAINVAAGTVTLDLGATASGTSTLNCCSAELREETQGVAGSRIRIIQWSNFKRFSSATLLDNFNFQIRIYETSNIVEIVYGQDSANATGIYAQVGLRGATNSDFNNRKTTPGAPNWSTTSAGTNNYDTCRIQNTSVPPSGLTFRYTPQVILDDVGCSAILSPVSGIPGSVTPSATIKNYGSNNQLVPFNVTCTINPGGYSSTIQDTISAGLFHNVSFANTNLSAGSYTVTVYTSLGTDQNHLNDTQRVVVTMLQPNYGSSGGYFFANNLATDQTSYPRWGWKDTTGSKSLVINGVSTGLATLVGSLDDGYFKLSLKNILLSLGQDTTDRHIKYNGICYDSIFPGTNGIIPLTEAYGTTSPNTFTMDAVNIANNCLLPFYHDFNLSTLTYNLTNRLSYKAKGDQLIITYSKVAAFAPAQEYASYQVVVELVTGCGGANSNFRYTYADTTNGMSSDSLVSDYLTSNNAAPPSATNFRNYTIGYTFTGAVNAYAQYCTSLNTFGGPNNGFVKRSIFNTTTEKGLTVEFGPNQNKLDLHNTHYMTLSLALEGLQNNPNDRRVRDTVQVILRDGSVAPYKIMEKQFVYLDSVSAGIVYGRKTFEMTMLKKSTNYYLQVKHRNSIATWSNLDSTQQLDTINYNFTSAICQAYGCNQVGVDAGVTTPSFYTGDPNQDGIVDASDIVAIYNDVTQVLEGDYLVTDLNWDGITDASDILLCYNNSVNVVGEIAPPGASRPVNGNIIPVELRAPIFQIPSTNTMTKEQYFISHPELDSRTGEYKIK